MGVLPLSLTHLNLPVTPSPCVSNAIDVTVTGNPVSHCTVWFVPAIGPAKNGRNELVFSGEFFYG